MFTQYSIPQAPGSARKLSQLKHLEPVQSQETLVIAPGSHAKPTIPAIDPDRHQRTQSEERRQVGCCVIL